MDTKENNRLHVQKVLRKSMGEILNPLGGNVHRILLQNEPIFTKFQENTHSEGKQIWNVSSLFFCTWQLVF